MAKKKATTKKKSTKKKSSTKPAQKRQRGKFVEEYDREAVMKIVCERLSEGMSLRAAVAAPADIKLPAESTVRTWLRDADSEFVTQYTRARELQLERWADEIIEIGEQDLETREIRNKKGELVAITVDNTWVQMQRLRIDSRKWILSKLCRTKYGESQKRVMAL